MSQATMQFELFKETESNETFEVTQGTFVNQKFNETKVIVRKLNRPSNSYRKNINPIYAASKENVLRELRPGTFIYFDSMVIPERMKLERVENGRAYGEMVDIKLDGTLVNRKCDGEVSIEVGKVIAFDTNAGPIFFTTDETTTASVISNEKFIRYFNGLSADLRNQFLVYAIYIANGHVTLNDIQGKRVDLMLKMGAALESFNVDQKVEFGYWESFFATKLVSSEMKWLIYYFGQECSIDCKELDTYFDEYMKIIISEKALSDMTDFELMGYYLLAGYNVQLNFITGEWSVSKIDSTKKLFVSREALNDSAAIEMLWNGLIEKEIAYVPTALLEDETSYKTKYSNQENQMKPFVIPTGSIVFLPDTYYSVTGHRLYRVDSDDGLYIDLVPINRDKERTTALGVKELRMPRKHIDNVFSEDKSNRKSIQVPYGIPEYMESTLEQLQKNLIARINEMSNEEMEQFLLLEMYSGRTKMFQAIRENDDELVDAFATSASGICNSLTHLSGVTFVKEQGELMYVTDNESIVSRLEGKTTRLSKNVVIKLEEKEALKRFKEMFSKVNTSFKDDSIQLTLPELILAYSLKGMVLSYEGTPTHFIVNGRTVHTTKHDLTAIQSIKTYIQ